MKSIPHPKEETTVVLIKPDGVKRGLIGEIIRRIEQRGLKIIGLSMISVDQKMIDDHYPKDPKWIRRLGEKGMTTFRQYGIDAKRVMGTDDVVEIGKRVRSWLIGYMTSGPLVKIVVRGIHAIDMIRKLCGSTSPHQAEMGTIRGDYSVDSPAAANRDQRALHNLVHASETPEEAAHEIAHWFTKEELHDYSRSDEDIMF